MAKIIISFEFDLHEEHEEFKQLSQYRDFYSALHEIKTWARTTYKHGNKDEISTEEVYEKINEILIDKGIEL